MIAVNISQKRKTEKNAYGQVRGEHLSPENWQINSQLNVYIRVLLIQIQSIIRLKEDQIFNEISIK